MYCSADCCFFLSVLKSTCSQSPRKIIFEFSPILVMTDLKIFIVIFCASSNIITESSIERPRMYANGRTSIIFSSNNFSATPFGSILLRFPTYDIINGSIFCSILPFKKPISSSGIDVTDLHKITFL